MSILRWSNTCYAVGNYSLFPSTVFFFSGVKGMLAFWTQKREGQKSIVRSEEYCESVQIVPTTMGVLTCRTTMPQSLNRTPIVSKLPMHLQVEVRCWNLEPLHWQMLCKILQNAVQVLCKRSRALRWRRCCVRRARPSGALPSRSAAVRRPWRGRRTLVRSPRRSQ